MEKIVSEIYSQCEKNLNSAQIDTLIVELYALMSIKEQEEDSIGYWEERDPYRAVERQNCLAFTS